MLDLIAWCLLSFWETGEVPNVPIEIPPGIYLNGTPYAAQGRWRNGNQVRFFRGLPQPIGGWTTVPVEAEVDGLQVVEYDGNDALDGTYTSSGHAHTTVFSFNLASFTGDKAVTLTDIEGPNAVSSKRRIRVNAYSSDYSIDTKRNTINVLIPKSGGGGTVFYEVNSQTGFADGKRHVAFISADIANGLFIFVIDGEVIDFSDSLNTSTQDSGAGTTITVGAINNTPLQPITGHIGFFGHDDQFRTNWADFMEGNIPKQIDETNWDEWGGSAPLFWASDGDLQSNAGTAGNLTAVGDPTVVDDPDPETTNFLPGHCRSMLSWRDSDAKRWLAIGSTQGLFIWDGSTLYDITPSGLGAGDEGNVLGPGYGSGLYGTETYGTARTQVISSIVTEPGSWSLDTWGENLVGVPNWEGNLYEWDPNTPSTAAVLVTGDTGTGNAQSPQQNRALVTTNERHLVLIGAGDFGGVVWNKNPRKVWWSDSEDNTVWVAAATNAAGDLELKTNGIAQCATRFQNEIIIWTNVDVHRMSYVGAPFYYALKSVGAKAGIIGQQAFVTTDNFIFWVGPEGFHIYDGVVRELEPEVWDHYIDRLNKSQQSQIAVGHNPRFNEIWVFYPSGDSEVNDSYIIWNYQENHWSPGDISRSAWNEALIWDNPIAARPYGNTTLDAGFTTNWPHDTNVDVVSVHEPDGIDYQIEPGTFQFLDPSDGTPYGTEDTDYEVEYVTGIVRTLSTGAFANNENITAEFTLRESSTPKSVLFFHEDGYSDERAGNPVRDAWIESAPVEIGQGDNLAVVRRIIQDTGREDDLDPVLNSNAVEVEFDTRLSPEGSVETHGPFVMDTDRGYTDVRFTGRQVAVRIRQAKNELWRTGRYRLDIVAGSGR